jgi:histone H3/H4
MHSVARQLWSDDSSDSSDSSDFPNHTLVHSSAGRKRARTAHTTCSPGTDRVSSENDETEAPDVGTAPKRRSVCIPAADCPPLPRWVAQDFKLARHFQRQAVSRLMECAANYQEQWPSPPSYDTSEQFLTNVIRDTMTYTEAEGRDIVSRGDVDRALDKCTRTKYVLQVDCVVAPKNVTPTTFDDYDSDCDDTWRCEAMRERVTGMKVTTVSAGGRSTAYRHRRIYSIGQYNSVFALAGGPSSSTYRAFLQMVLVLTQDYKTDLRYQGSALRRLQLCVAIYREQWPASSGEQFLKNIIHDAVAYCEHARRKTVTRSDVDHALDRSICTQYAYEG